MIAARSMAESRKAPVTESIGRWADSLRWISLGCCEMSALDQETGVNHIYLFGEWFNQNLGLGANQMRIGTSTWTAGMTFEF